MEVKQRFGTASEAEEIIAAQLAAFADEAVMRWAQSDPAQAADLGAAFSDQAVREALELDEVLLAVTGFGHIVGVSMWQYLDSAKRPAEAAAEVAAASAVVPGLERVVRLTSLIAERHPDQPHLYLASIGVVPEWRGRGVGAALLRHRLAAADAAGQPVYLEASTARSRDLYARHGFADREPAIALPDDGPCLYPMWREPVTSD